MTTKRVRLADGIWLNMVQTDRFKTACVSINFLQPLREETASLHALLPSVLLRGCMRYPDMRSITHRLDDLYGASIGSLIRKKGEVHTLGLYADFLEDRYIEDGPIFDQMMDLIGQLLFEPCMENNGFVEEYVTGERQNLLNSIAARINDKRSYSVSRLLKHMCASEAYRITKLGEKEALEKVTAVSLYEIWQHVLKTSPVELFYLGQKSEEQVLAQMKKLISHLPERSSLCEPKTEVIMPQRPVQMIEEALDVTQGKLSIGLRTSITALDERYPALKVLNAVYGAGMTSKLFTKIREEQSLCYYASSSIDRYKGIMVVTSGIEFDKYEVARDGILKQLELCKKGQITEDELRSAKKYLISAVRTNHDSPGQMDEFVSGQMIGGSGDTVESLIQKLEQVTLDQVVAAAGTLVLDTVYFLKGVKSV
ncbi:MAG: insulinase family protein [Oscillospiraceae bacterium]|nr:insulinase family protein [Oscillospiraceae bacterium]